MMAVRWTEGFLIAFSCLIATLDAQIIQEARWCTVSTPEMRKCEALQLAIGTRKIQDNTNYPHWAQDGYDALPDFQCVETDSRFACMEMIGDNEADLIALDPGMAYTGGQYNSFIPLIAEKYEDGGNEGLDFKAVAIVRRDNRDITSIDNLAGKKACHPAVGHAAGWVYPISTLIREKKMPIVECNVPVKSAAAFFGDMCAPNGLSEAYNPFGNNPVSVCQNCKGEGADYCTSSDPYAGYHGAFLCMASGDGDIAFVRDSTVFSATAQNTSSVPDDFELLCMDGRRAPVTQASTCNWGTVAAHVVSTSAIHDQELRDKYKTLIKLLDDDFGVDGAFKSLFKLYDSSQWNEHDLLFTDETVDLKDVSEVKDENNNPRDTYYTWVGTDFTERIEILNTCPEKQARWCVISEAEMEKCENMIMAFNAKKLKPDLNCILGLSIRDCMEKIKTGDADLMAVDAADVYIAGKYYGLIPLATEDYSGYDTQIYYAVAVARKVESHLTIFNLKGRRSCHSGVMTAAGWVVPVAKLVETEQIRINDGNLYQSVGQLFSKSCVPGVLSEYYNPHGTNPINLCEACAAGGLDRCQRNNDENYYGNSGAFRCLTERGGDIAFMKHTTVRENTDGRNHADWARNRRSDDYQLMCNDGTRRDIDDWAECNMGEVPANAIITASFKTQEQRQIYWTLLNLAQQEFASDQTADFSMFDSMLIHKDLIFQDSTVRLILLDIDQQNYQSYLGSTFVRSMQRLESYDFITAGASSTVSPVITTLVTLIFTAHYLKQHLL